MNFDKCGNCVGKAELNCVAARRAAALGIEQVAGFDQDIREQAIEGIAARVGARIVEGGCGFTIKQVRAQIAERPIS